MHWFFTLKRVSILYGRDILKYYLFSHVRTKKYLTSFKWPMYKLLIELVDYILTQKILLILKITSPRLG